MKGYLLSAWFLLLIHGAVALRAAEPAPGVWFFNANGTGFGSEPVYFSVGGTIDTPPQKQSDVLVGWSWDQQESQIDCYPGRAKASHLPPTKKELKISSWKIKNAQDILPTVGIGAGWELFFLGQDSTSTRRAEGWAELLDTIEAAYRHSSPNLVNAERHGTIEIGLFGGCDVMSRPVKGPDAGWKPRFLDNRARPSKAHHLGSPRPSIERMAPIQVQRFFRWIEDPDGDSQICLGDEPFLHLFEVPKRFGSFPTAFFLLWKKLELAFPDMFALEPGPRPGVREVVSSTKTGPIGTVNIPRWPARVEGESTDLCRLPIMDQACRADADLRAMLVTSVGADGVLSVRKGCEAKMEALGIPGDPCSDPDVWRSKTGIYLTDYLGPMSLVGPSPLVGQDELVSEVSADGGVQWLWRGAPASGEVTARLADDRLVNLVLPSLDSPDKFLSQNPTPPTGVSTDPSTDPFVDPSTVPPPTGEEVLGPGSNSTSPTGLTPSFLESLRGLLASGQDGPTWRNPKLLIGVSVGLLLFMGLIFFLRRSSDGPPSRTSFVRRVSSPEETETEESSGAVLQSAADLDLPLAAPMLPPPPTPLAEPEHEEADLAPTIEGEPVSQVIEPEPSPLVVEAESVPSLIALKPIVPPVIEPKPVSTPVAAPVSPPIPPPPPLDSPTEILRAESVSAPSSEPPAVKTAKISPDSFVVLLQPLRKEIESLEPLERQALRQTIDATHRLARWISSALPVLREIEEGHGLARFESLPLPSRREWIDAYDALRQFATVDAPVFEQLLPTPPTSSTGFSNQDALASYLETSGLQRDERPLRERLRRHLLAHDPPGRVHGIVLALQYLLEAFPMEHLDAANRKAYHAALRQKLLESGVPPQLHRVISELAQGLGLRYQEVRYYKVEIGEPGFEFLENAHDRISLSARVGYEAGTEGRIIVRLTEIFLFESASGAYYSGRAVIDEYAT